MLTKRIYLPETLSSNGEVAAKSKTTWADTLRCDASGSTNEDGVGVSVTSATEEWEMGLLEETTLGCSLLLSLRDIVGEVLDGDSATL